MIKLVCVVGLVLSQGCASYVAVSGRNSELDRQALKMELRSDPHGTEGFVAMDLLGAKGYMGAWREEPAKMAGATVIDVLLAGGAFMLYDELKSDGKSSSKKEDDETVVLTGASLHNTITGDGNTINQNVIIQAPNGSGSGMQGNTGSGGLANVGGE